MRKMFDAHLDRVDWDRWQYPVRLHPFTDEGVAHGRTISIAADVAFGRPVLVHRSVTTTAIAERIDAGETVEALADDYDLSISDIEAAVLYEHAA